MARASNIYFAQRRTRLNDPAYSAAFTVKHEMLKWLKGRETEFIVWRLPDGGGPTNVVIMDGREASPTG